ncbi:MAG: hypothetical protein U0452_05360 [Anaerolineae bacterium]
MTPVKVTLNVPDGAEIVMGAATQDLGHLAGASAPPPGARGCASGT